MLGMSSCECWRRSVQFLNEANVDRQQMIVQEYSEVNGLYSDTIPLMCHEEDQSDRMAWECVKGPVARRHGELLWRQLYNQPPLRLATHKRR